MKPIDVPRVRLGSQVFDLGIPLGHAPTEKFEGFVLKPMVKGLNLHVTISTAGQCLEVHVTDERTGSHASILRVDLYWVAQRLADPTFLDRFRERLIAASFAVPSSRALRATGTRALMCLPTDNKGLKPDSDGVVTAPCFHSLAMRDLRRAPHGTIWAALAEGGRCVGFVWTARLSQQERAVWFTHWPDIQALLESFMSELAHPDTFHLSPGAMPFEHVVTEESPSEIASIATNDQNPA